MSRGRGIWPTRSAVILRQLSDLQHCAAASPIALELATPRAMSVEEKTAAMMTRAKRGYIARAEEPSTLVSFRPKRVLWCGKLRRQGQLKTITSTRPTCMHKDFMLHQLAVARDRWAITAVALHWPLARRRDMIGWRVRRTLRGRGMPLHPLVQSRMLLGG